MAARQHEIDAIMVWRLDRWGRSRVDLISTLQELASLRVGFASLYEALDTGLAQVATGKPETHMSA